MKRQSGFTLVEIAIVLVVIGLLLGGVLKGQELVLNSRIRNTINEYNNVASAMFAYQDRYRQIPGDDSTVDARWDNVPPGNAVDPGNGDGIIGGGNVYIGAGSGMPANPPLAETGLFWQHLRNDNLVTGPRTGLPSLALPRNSFDGFTGIEDSVLGAIIGPAICQSNIGFRPSTIIDTRIDDGTGNLGTLLAAVEAPGVNPDVSFGAAPSAYAPNTPNRYTLCRQL